MILTGRECEATARRMKEMKVDFLVQDCKDKITYLRHFMQEENLLPEEIGYLGDDLNDLPPMSLCGFVGCPQDACREVKERADYVSEIKGGYGAVRDIIEHMLRMTGKWEMITREVYGIGV